MAVLSGFPILSTDDLPRLVAFYEQAFGAERTYEFAHDDAREAYVALRIGGALLGISAEGDAARATGRVALWFYVDDVDETYRQAEQAGASTVTPPEDMPWGERVAVVQDIDGFTINLGAAARDLT